MLENRFPYDVTETEQLSFIKLFGQLRISSDFSISLLF